MASLISKDLSNMQGTKWPTMWHPRTVQQAIIKTVTVYAGPASTSVGSAIVVHHAQVATMATHTTQVYTYNIVNR